MQRLVAVELQRRGEIEVSMVPTLPAAVFEADVTMAAIISPVSSAVPVLCAPDSGTTTFTTRDWQRPEFVAVAFVVVYRSGSCMIWDFCEALT
jgi:hypothetical protein